MLLNPFGLTLQLQADVFPETITRPYIEGRNVIKVVYDYDFDMSETPVPSDFVVTVDGTPVTIFDVDWKNLHAYRLYSELVPEWVGEVVVTYSTPSVRLRLVDGRLADPYSMVAEIPAKAYDPDDAYKPDA